MNSPVKPIPKEIKHTGPEHTAPKTWGSLSIILFDFSSSDSAALKFQESTDTLLSAEGEIKLPHGAARGLGAVLLSHSSLAAPQAGRGRCPLFISWQEWDAQV